MGSGYIFENRISCQPIWRRRWIGDVICHFAVISQINVSNFHCRPVSYNWRGESCWLVAYKTLSSIKDRTYNNLFLKLATNFPVLIILMIGIHFLKHSWHKRRHTDIQIQAYRHKNLLMKSQIDFRKVCRKKNLSEQNSL